MKKIIYITFTALVLMFSSFTSNASTNMSREEIAAKAAKMTKEEKKARLEDIEARVMIIKDMDKSTLSREQRKGLRQELRMMNKEARVMSKGVYLSVGAIIIIILLLILIL